MTNEAEPSEVARDIANAAMDRFRDRSEIMYTVRDEIALSIDSAIADAVRKEAEECANAMAERSAVYEALIDKGQGVWPGPDYVRNDTWVDWGARRSALEQAERAIRARHTPDSKEQPR